MGFAKNLKQIRKENELSQEELAELLGVSRQAVSKWEQGVGYPEVEKLLLLSNTLNVSLDSLMSTRFAKEEKANIEKIPRNILITSPHENVIVNCHKVSSSQKFMAGRHSPHYALFGISIGSSFWGEPTTFLGWYADHESISKEIEEIKKAIIAGMVSYELKYSVKVEKHLLGMKIINE